MKKNLCACGFVIALLTILGMVPGIDTSVTASAQVTEKIDLKNGDVSGEKYSYNSYANELTLEDGFSINVNNVNAIESNTDLTIILKGDATITSNQSGIVTNGSITIRSYSDMYGAYSKYGKLIVNAGSGNGTNYYGIYTGTGGGNISVTEYAQLEVKGGDYSIGQGGVNKNISVSENGIVKLTKASSNGEGIATKYQVKNTESYIVKQGNTADYILSENFSITGTSNSFELFTFSMSGPASFVYDGKKHNSLKANDSIMSLFSYSPVNFNYNETIGSEYLNSGSISYREDYRDKEINVTNTNYSDIAAISNEVEYAPINAGTYNLKYGNIIVKNGSDNFKVTIAPRKVTVTGLKVKTAKKTFDGHDVADIDYSDIDIACVNGDNNGTGSFRGILQKDLTKLGTDIIPFAMAYYLDESDAAGATEYFGDGKKYVKSGNVAYDDDGVFAGVVSKPVLITEITLSDPNYQVVTSDTSDAAPNFKDSGYIYPRNIEDAEGSTITHTLTPDSYKYTEEGYLESDIGKVLKDSSNKTKGGKGADIVLVEDKDYFVEPNYNRIKEVGTHTITVTGTGNYRGTRMLTWTIEKATRKIDIIESPTVKKVYDGNSYGVLKGAGDDNTFYYTVTDTDNGNADLTESNESSDRTIVYEGIDGTAYSESDQAPVNAGKYKVTVSLQASEHYSAAEKSLEFTIFKKTVSLTWHVSGASVNEDNSDPENPTELVYNGTANVFRAVVSNPIGNDVVNVTEIEYEGVDGTDYTKSNVAPKAAGKFKVTAKAVDNDNYILAATTAYELNGTERIEHSYTVDKKSVVITWLDGGAEFVYDTKKHGLTPAISGICKNAEGVEDVVNVKTLDYGESKDVFGQAYTNDAGAINASDGTISVKASELDNPNYKIDTQSATGTFTILKRSISDLVAGTYADKKDIWAEKLTYNGKIQSPVIKWLLKIGEEEHEFGLTKNTDYTATGSYQAREHSDNENGLLITITGINNYEGNKVISWNIEKLESSIEVSYASLLEEGQEKYSVRVGYIPDDPVIISYTNAEISNNLEDDVKNHISYHYEGTMINGTPYDSDDKPTLAGDYKVIVTLEATAHFNSSSAEAEFSVLAEPVKLLNIKAVDKYYDGSKTADLDFGSVVFDGVSDADMNEYKAAFYAALTNGKVEYEAEFDSADVKINDGTVEDKPVEIKKILIDYDDALPDVLFKYTVSDYPQNVNAKINPKKITVTGISVADKTYDGKTDAQSNATDMNVTGALEGESLDVSVNAAFKDKNVSIDQDTNNAKAKTVDILYTIQAGDETTKASNYCIDEAASQMTSEAVISPKKIAVSGLKAKARQYDGTDTAEIDWSTASLTGLAEADVNEVKISAHNKVMYPNDKYEDANVAYDGSKNVIEKAGTITKDEYKIVLDGDCANDNYYMDDTTYSGVINPKKLTGVKWTFDKYKLEDIPKAQYMSGCGLIGDDTCEAVVKIYAKADEGYTTVIPEAELADRGLYVTKIVSVTADNYCVNENDATILYSFMYHTTKNASNLKITNYMSAEGEKYSIIYGNEIPDPILSYDNEDLLTVPDDEIGEYITVRYTGKTSLGEDYDSELKPTEVGSYTVKAKIKETANYNTSEDSVEFEIAKRPVVIKSGIAVKDKVYDGNTKASLDFSNAVIEGVAQNDKEAFENLLKTDGSISYSADFVKKDVFMTSGEVADLNVNVSDIAFNVTDTSPDCLANYTFASEGGQENFSGKILPKAVTVTGIKVTDKIYDTKTSAKTDLSDVNIDGIIDGESFDVSAAAHYLDKNVSIDQTTGEVKAKPAYITYLLIPADTESKESNYYIDENTSTMIVNSVITPVKLKVTGLKTDNRDYDKTTTAKIDWNTAVLTGILPGDDVSLSEENSEVYPNDQYTDANVEYDKKGNIISKTGVITSAEHKILLSGDDADSNYYVDEVSYEGMITPKKISGVEWTFDEKKLLDVPKAVYKGDCGLIEGDEVETVVEFFKKEDTTFEKAIDAELLTDNSEYVARVTDVTSGNYIVNADDDTITYPFTYRNLKESPELKINNYGKTDGKAFSISYGEKLPEPEITNANEDIEEGEGSSEQDYIIYRYTGKMQNGKAYDSLVPPTAAGDYIVTVIIKETEHYRRSETSQAFSIAPKTITISSGIAVKDKTYNGSTKAELDLSQVVLEGVLDEDIEEVKRALNVKDNIKYKADFSQKDVLLVNGELKDIDVDVRDLEINYAGCDSDVLCNYAIADSGDQREIKGKILKRNITIAGIAVLDKVYDGTDKANVDISNIKFEGLIKGEKLKVDATGTYLKSGDEAGSKDVLYGQDGKVASKKALVSISELKAGDTTTLVDNYYLAETERKKEMSAVIKPCELNSCEWSFDENTGIPGATFTEKNGIIKGETPEVILSVYKKSDKTFTKKIATNKLTSGEIYVARVEAVGDTNYCIADPFKNQVYTFAYEHEEEKTEDSTPTAAEKLTALNSLNQGLMMTVKDKTITFKWGKVTNADGYLVYTGVKGEKYAKAKTVKKGRSYSYKYDDESKKYQAYVKAYRLINGKKYILAKSYWLRIGGSKVVAFNPVKVGVKKTALKLARKKSVSAGGYMMVKKNDKNLKKTGKNAYLRYWSDNKKIATVTSAGKITAVKKGTCNVYVMARNGKKKKITVTVN